MFKFIFWYFTIANISFGILLLASLIAIVKRLRRLKRTGSALQFDYDPNIKVSVLVPAHNEELVINHSVRSWLTQDYKNIEVIIIDDGSSDDTLLALTKEYKLIAKEIQRHSFISTAEAIVTYTSLVDSRLIVIRQNNCGKAGALNTGLDFSSGVFVATADADTVVNRDGLIRFAHELQDLRLKAVGGCVKLLNASKKNASFVTQEILPNRLILMCQKIEYLRTFYSGRIGWDVMQGSVMLAGALACFRKDSLLAVRGFNTESITEDLEVVVRMRQYYGQRKVRDQEGEAMFRILPDPVCWTQAPESWHHLRKQRNRWQRGEIQTILANFKMLFNPRYRMSGLGVLPYMFVYDLLGPIVELISLIYATMKFLNGEMSFHQSLYFAFITFTYSVGLTLCTVFIDRLLFQSEDDRTAPKITFNFVFKYLIFAIPETFGYRQLLWLYRLEATLFYWFKKHEWGFKKRQAIS